MENPVKIESLYQNQDYSKSPEFEFWMVRNPSIPQPHILTADQLFSQGLLLPLHNVDPIPSPTPEPGVDDAELLVPVSAGPEITVSEPDIVSRRWKDIFKKPESSKSNPTKETATLTDQKVELPKTNKKRERKMNSGGGGQTTTLAAELKIINIWPFSRSRSAKTSSTRSKVTTGGRKVCSAPCSRSNSGSEFKSRKLPGSPAHGGGGIHVGRNSPVWQARRGGATGVSRFSVVDRESVKPGCGRGVSGNGCKEEIAASNGGKFGGGKMRIGDSHDGSGGKFGGGKMRIGDSHDGSGVVNRFNFRNLFNSTRKVY